MITEGQYLDALKTVRSYLKQIDNEFNSEERMLRDTNVEPFLSDRAISRIKDCWNWNYKDETMLYVTLYNLTMLTEKKLLKTRYVGRVLINEINSVMAMYGLELKTR